MPAANSPYAARTYLRRVVRTGLILSGATLASVSVAAWAAEATGDGTAAGLAGVLVPGAATFLLAPHASYRRRDSLLCLIGIGVWIFVVIVWRIAYLPYRDWPPRPDEAPYADWFREPEHAGIWRLRRDAAPRGPGGPPAG